MERRTPRSPKQSFNLAAGDAARLAREISSYTEQNKVTLAIRVDAESGQKKMLFSGMLVEVDFSQPPIDTERKYNLTGISGHYTLPRGVDAEMLQDYVINIREDAFENRMTMDERFQRMDDIVDALEQLNPTLKNLTYNRDSMRDIYSVVLGVASAFNTKDIQHFLDMSLTGKPNFLASLEIPAWKELHDTLRRTDIEFYWVPASATMQDIIRQTQKLDIKNTSAPKIKRG